MTEMEWGLKFFSVVKVLVRNGKHLIFCSRTFYDLFVRVYWRTSLRIKCYYLWWSKVIIHGVGLKNVWENVFWKSQHKTKNNINYVANVQKWQLSNAPNDVLNKKKVAYVSRNRGSQLTNKQIWSGDAKGYRKEDFYVSQCKLSWFIGH